MPLANVRLVLAGMIWLSSGCRHAEPEPWRGESAFRVVRPPAPGRTDAKPAAGPASPRRRVVEAEPILPLKMPEYPAAALAARAGAAQVGVFVVIDPTGRVASVDRSFAVYSTPGAFADQFLAAVQEAVRQWRFRPAELHELEPVEQDGAIDWRLAKVERSEAEFTLEFTFTASGEVRLPPARRR